jgi:hypothetical protein
MTEKTLPICSDDIRTPLDRYRMISREVSLTPRRRGMRMSRGARAARADQGAMRRSALALACGFDSSPPPGWVVWVLLA